MESLGSSSVLSCRYGRVHKPTKGSKVPPVEEWLEIRKIVSIKKKRALDAADAQNNTNTANATEPLTQANSNSNPNATANANTAAEGLQKNSPKVATKNAPKIPPAASTPNSTESSTSAPSPLTARKTPNKRRYSLRSGHTAGSKNRKLMVYPKLSISHNMLYKVPKVGM